MRNLPTDDVEAELWYPRSDDRPKGIVVSLIDVRAVDDIRISYDFDRDGWVVQQRPDNGQFDINGELLPNGEVGTWQEVAFVKAWGT